MIDAYLRELDSWLRGHWPSRERILDEARTHLEDAVAVVRELLPARFKGPKQKLHQRVLNLIVNAMHAIEAKPVDGCGRPEEVRSRILEPFFNTKPVGVGTGLGLSVCAMVVQRVGGTIDVMSRVGEGTTVTVRLPCELLTQE